MKECLSCDYYDSETESCAVPSPEQEYACPLWKPPTRDGWINATQYLPQESGYYTGVIKNNNFFEVIICYFDIKFQEFFVYDKNFNTFRESILVIAWRKGYWVPDWIYEWIPVVIIQPIINSDHFNYLLDGNGRIMKFANKEEAYKYLYSIGLTDDDIKNRCYIFKKWEKY